MKIELKELEALTTKALINYGYDDNEAAIIRDMLLYAQLRGNNQGVVKLIGKGIPKDPGAKDITIEKETALSVKINGNQNQAMLVVKKALDVVLEKAKAHGIGIAGTYNTSTSSGAIGYVASEIAEKGLIGLVFASSPPRVATAGSFQPIFGTNPIAVGIPAKPSPIILDMSTAAMAFYGLVEAQTAGKKIPDDVAYGPAGEPTCEPSEAIKGAIRSFDRGYKGAGLALIIEILAGPLVGAACVGVGEPARNWGHLVLAIDPNLFGDREAFIGDVTTLIEKVKSTQKLPGVDEIFVPGERGNHQAAEIRASGMIEVEDNLLAELRKAAG
ncbi:MAG TPA: Ldh family oxidoreductase [Thermodesulfobacteriota bacterium]|nr:Ldh family oxidoreductase [Thermodesulfobacteriota bacterium]